MRGIIIHCWFEIPHDYKPLTLGSKIEAFPCLVQKLFVKQTAPQYKPGNKYTSSIL